MTYTPNWLFRNKHFNTIWNSKVRSVDKPNYKRIRITTPDDDFLDLDTVLQNNLTVSILVHGLEGSSESTYIKSLANKLIGNNHDIVAVNLRGCSGSPNNVVSSYNSGRTEDIKTVINYIKSNFNYISVNLIGFSLGGNLVLKYAGESDGMVDKIATVSVPCDLKSSCHQIEKGFNKIYNLRFVLSLKKKIKQKIAAFPNIGISSDQLNSIKTVYDFDNIYTAPIHGYENADDYYMKCSSKQFIKDIKTPTLLINALDDPFLTSECFPFEECRSNENITFETPKHGGHVSFLSSSNDKLPYHEKLILDFIISQN